MIVTLTGPSGVGKTTIAQELVHRIPNARLVKSFTTRDPRESDAEGEYIYLSERWFRAFEYRNSFLWTTTVRGKHYGTTEDAANEAIRTPAVRIMILVPSCVRRLREYTQQKHQGLVFSFFIVARLDTALRRIRKERHLSRKEVAREEKRYEELLSCVQDHRFIPIENTGKLERAVGHIEKGLPLDILVP